MTSLCAYRQLLICTSYSLLPISQDTKWEGEVVEVMGGIQAFCETGGLIVQALAMKASQCHDRERWLISSASTADPWL